MKYKEGDRVKLLRLDVNDRSEGLSVGSMGVCLVAGYTVDNNRLLKIKWDDISINYSVWSHQIKLCNLPKKTSKPQRANHLTCTCDWVIYRDNPVRRYHHSCKVHKQ